MTTAGLCHSFCYPEALDASAGLARDGTRALVVHHHLFKHAGSTLDDALRRNFGRAFLDDIDERRLHSPTDGLGAFLAGEPGLKCISSHLLRLPLPEVSGRRLLLLTLLRHPIERVISVYKYERAKQSSIDPRFTRSAVEKDIAGFVERCLSFDMVPAVRNFHVSQMLPHPVDWRRPFGRDDLARAISHLDRIPLIGLVERFDESMVLFEHVLAPIFPGIDLSTVRRNVTPGERQDMERRLDGLRGSLGETLHQRLLEANALDLELYARGREEFETRLSAIPGLGARLDDYKARCASREARDRRLLVRVRRKLCETLGC